MFVGIIDLFFARKIARSKSRILLAFWQAIFGGFIHTPETPEAARSAGPLPGLLEALVAEVKSSALPRQANALRLTTRQLWVMAGHLGVAAPGRPVACAR